MKRISDLKTKLIFTAVYLCVIAAFYIFNIPCMFKNYTGVSCLGCGMTRAIASALRFDFGQAFKYHAMFWSVPLLYLYFLYDGVLFKNKFINYLILIIIALGFVFNWILHIVV